MPAKPATDVLRSDSLPVTVQRALPFFAFITLQAALAWLLLGSLTPDLPGGRADGGYYLHYMKTLATSGWASLPDQFAAWNGDPRNWLFPPPSRVGFFAALWLTEKAVGASLLSIAYLSTAAHLSAVCVNWLFARRHVGELQAFLFATAMGFSPALLGVARLPLTDSFVCFCLSVVVWTFYEVVCDPRRRGWQLAFALSFFFAILTKELAALVCIPLAAFVLLERYWRGRRDLSLPLFVALFAIPGLLTVPVIVTAAGSLDTLLITTKIVLQSPRTNAYALQECSGPWYRYIIDYMCFSPAFTLLALGGAGAFAMRLRSGNYERVLVFFCVVGAGLLILYAPLIKNLRYVLLLETSLRMLAVWFLWQLFSGAASFRARSGLVVAMALLCFLDWRSFEELWIVHRGYDPVTSYLMDVREIIPGPR